MAIAQVTLKEGGSYSWKGHTFTKSPSQITNAEDIAFLKTIGCLQVQMLGEEGPKPKAAVKAPVQPDVSESAEGTESESEGEEGEPEQPKSKGKPGPKPKG